VSVAENDREEQLSARRDAPVDCPLDCRCRSCIWEDSTPEERASVRRHVTP
jgi:hypothetical protein